jgi:hypothetical protein
MRIVERCGCSVVVTDGAGEIGYCAVHAAAPRLIAKLIEAVTVLNTMLAQPDEGNWPSPAAAQRVADQARELMSEVQAVLKEVLPPDSSHEHRWPTSASARSLVDAPWRPQRQGEVGLALALTCYSAGVTVERRWRSCGRLMTSTSGGTASR